MGPFTFLELWLVLLTNIDTKRVQIGRFSHGTSDNIRNGEGVVAEIRHESRRIRGLSFVKIIINVAV